MNAYINPKAPENMKDMLGAHFPDSKRTPTAKYHFDYENHDEEFFFGGCPICGNYTDVKHLGIADWCYCEEHKTAWCPGSGLYSKNRDESDQDTVRFFLNGGYSNIKPIFTRQELPENKAAMLEDLRYVPVTYVYELRLINNQVVEESAFGLHPLPDSCDVQIRFSNNRLRVEEKLTMLKQIIRHLETLE